MTTDIQKAAFAHLISADYARLTRETTGHLVSRLTNDLTFIQQAAQTSLVAFVRDVLSVVAVFCRDALPRLDDDADRARPLSDCGPAGPQHRPAAALGVAANADRARRHDLAADREAGRRAPDQGVPSRGLRRPGAQREFRAGLPAADEGRARARARRALRSKPWRDWPSPAWSASPTGASPAAPARSATFWASSPHCCWRRSPSSRWATVTTATLEGLAAAERIYELLDEKPTVVDRPDRAAARDRRPAPSCSTTSASPTTLGAERSSRQEFLAHGARRQDGGARRPLGRRQVDR